MTVITRRRVGGTTLLVAAGWFGRETLSWALGQILDFAKHGAGNVSLATFPWHDTLALALAVGGAYLAFWPRKRAKIPSESNRATGHARRASAIIVRIRDYRHNPFLLSHRDPLSDIVRDGISVLIEIRKDGYRIPELPAMETEQLAVLLLAYFGPLIPLWRDGHLAEARSFAPEVAASSLSEAKAMSANQFYA